MIEGVDVSNHNGTVDFAALWKTGVRFAFCKASEGVTYRDPTYSRNIGAVRAVGMVRGSYHFARPANDPTAEAEHYLKAAAPGPGHLVALDLEDTGGRRWAKVDVWKDTWLAYVKAARPGCRVGLYANVACWKSLPGSNCGDFLWIAHYTGAAAPDIRHPWTFWQYTDKPHDRSRARFPTFEALKAWADGSPAPAPAPLTLESLAARLAAIEARLGIEP